MSFLQVRWVFAGVLLVASVLLGVAPASAASVVCAEQASVLLCDADGDAIVDVVEEAICGTATCATGAEDADGNGIADAEELALSLKTGGPGGPVQLTSPSSLMVVGPDGSITSLELWPFAGAATLFLAAVAVVVLLRRRDRAAGHPARHRTRLEELVS